MTENEPQAEAVMTIVCNSKLEVKTNYRGHPSLMLGMLGGVRFAEEWCIGQLRERENGLCEDQKSIQLLHVSKAEAMSAYYEALNKLRDRISVISASSDQQSFDIPSSLQSL